MADDSNEERNGVGGRERRRLELLNWICGYGAELKEWRKKKED